MTFMPPTEIQILNSQHCLHRKMRTVWGSGSFQRCTHGFTHCTTEPCLRKGCSSVGGKLWGTNVFFGEFGGWLGGLTYDEGCSPAIWPKVSLAALTGLSSTESKNPTGRPGMGTCRAPWPPKDGARLRRQKLCCLSWGCFLASGFIFLAMRCGTYMPNDHMSSNVKDSQKHPKNQKSKAEILTRLW